MRRLIQLTLDLFDLRSEPTSAAPPATAAPATPATPPSRTPRPPPPVPPWTPAAVPAPAPARPGQTVPAPTPTPAPDPLAAPPPADAAHFRHPRANRALRLGPVWVAYAFQRGRRRTIGFSVGPEGLQVRAPGWTPQAQIDAALQDKAGWILRKLEQARSAQRAAARPVWQDGAAIPYLGQALALSLQAAPPYEGEGAGAGAARPAAAQRAQQTLHLSLPADAQAAQIRDAAQAWLQREARRVFQERLDHYAPLLGVRWQRLALSQARTRWGSANSSGVIRLNWRLIHLSLPVIDYVVVHELSHLRVMNHSPQFWDTVASVMPDYRHQREQLRSQATALPE